MHGKGIGIVFGRTCTWRPDTHTHKSTLSLGGAGAGSWANRVCTHARAHFCVCGRCSGLRALRTLCVIACAALRCSPRWYIVYVMHGLNGYKNLVPSGAPERRTQFSHRSAPPETGWNWSDLFRAFRGPRQRIGGFWRLDAKCACMNRNDEASHRLHVFAHAHASARNAHLSLHTSGRILLNIVCLSGVHIACSQTLALRNVGGMGMRSNISYYVLDVATRVVAHADPCSEVGGVMISYFLIKNKPFWPGWNADARPCASVRAAAAAGSRTSHTHTSHEWNEYNVSGAFI